MKIQNTKNSHNTNAPGQSHDFQIGDAGMVIEILRSRLYKSPIRTLVQEYISNARDAVREAGEPDHRIKVTAPTYSNPVFSVRDYGKGIDPDRMVNVFIRYGSSTKRDSNNQTGGFGIGAKSAWAYADQFSIITRIDGVQRDYLAHIAGKNNGQLEFVSETTTTEENGTEIQVPVRGSDIDSFHLAIQRATMFWDERPTMVDLKEEKWFNIKPILNEGGIIMLPPDFYNDSSSWRVWDSSTRFLVVDGIPYNADSLGVRDISIDDCFVALRCNTGDVDVSANREGLSENPENTSVIAGIVKKANQSIEELKNKQAEASSDLKSYLNTLAFWHKYSKDVSGIKPKYGLTLDDNGYLTFNGKTLQGSRWGEDRGKIRCRQNTYITISELSSFPLMVLVDVDIGAASRTARIKHAMSLAGKKTAFGLPDTAEVVDLEIIDLRLSQLKAPRKQGVRSPNGTSTRQPVSKTYNLKRWSHYDGFRNNFVDFSNLSTNSERYVYADEKTDNRIMSRYFNLLKDTSIQLIGVGTLAKKAIEKIRSKYPSKFMTFEDISQNPKLLGSDYAKVVSRVRDSVIDRSDDKNMRAFLGFSGLKGIEGSLDRLKDETFRKEFKRLIPSVKNRSSYDLPEEIATAILKKEVSIPSDVKIMKMLGELLLSKMPFITAISDYSFEKNQGDSLIDTLNVLIEMEAK